jgi:hypothetical protein
MTGPYGSRAYGAGVAVAFVTSFLILWTSIVRDDGQALGNFGVIMAGMVGAFAASFRPEGMARTMLAVAAMQMLIGLAVATAPITAAVPDGVFKAWVSNSVFAALWLLSAAFFRTASRHKPVLAADDRAKADLAFTSRQHPRVRPVSTGDRFWRAPFQHQKTTTLSLTAARLRGSRWRCPHFSRPAASATSCRSSTCRPAARS